MKTYRILLTVKSGGRKPQSAAFYKDIETAQPLQAGMGFLIGDTLNRVHATVANVDDVNNVVMLQPIIAQAHRDYDDVITKMRRSRWNGGT